MSRIDAMMRLRVSGEITSILYCRRVCGDSPVIYDYRSLVWRQILGNRAVLILVSIASLGQDTLAKSSCVGRNKRWRQRVPNHQCNRLLSV